MLQIFLQQLAQSSGLELIAVLLAVAYLLLAVREDPRCWYAAFASTLIFLVLFWQVKLYMESVLQVYYLGMAVYGWYQWRRPDDGLVSPIQRWHWSRHGIVIFAVASLSMLSGFLLERYTDAQSPYLDAFTTWASIVTTYMVTRKILENWAYWLLIDMLSIYLYLDRGLYFTSLLFAVYIVIIFFGWYRWQQRYLQQGILGERARDKQNSVPA
ncbi:MAG: nicotinamide mononucleotide transporter [Candidatus Azotimanducaceae bacterium]|jgi:nicotinamide mononucleotide transporter